MNSDIKINGNILTLEGDFIHVRGVDLWLDSPDRRKVEGGLRRALVHDFDDGLTINWAKDYPGGVTIQGDVYIPGQVEAQGITARKINLVYKIKVLPGLPELEPIEMDLGEVITELQNKITSLEARIAALEAKTWR